MIDRIVLFVCLTVGLLSYVFILWRWIKPALVRWWSGYTDDGERVELPGARVVDRGKKPPSSRV